MFVRFARRSVDQSPFDPLYGDELDDLLPSRVRSNDLLLIHKYRLPFSSDGIANVNRVC